MTLMGPGTTCPQSVQTRSCWHVEDSALSNPRLRRTEQNRALLLLSWVTNPSYRTNPSYQPLAPTPPTDPPVAHRWKSVGLLPAAREES